MERMWGCVEWCGVVWSGVKGRWRKEEVGRGRGRKGEEEDKRRKRKESTFDTAAVITTAFHLRVVRFWREGGIGEGALRVPEISVCFSGLSLVGWVAPFLSLFWVFDGSIHLGNQWCDDERQHGSPLAHVRPEVPTEDRITLEAIVAMPWRGSRFRSSSPWSPQGVGVWLEEVRRHLLGSSLQTPPRLHLRAPASL